MRNNIHELYTFEIYAGLVDRNASVNQTIVLDGLAKTQSQKVTKRKICCQTVKFNHRKVVSTMKSEPESVLIVKSMLKFAKNTVKKIMIAKYGTCQMGNAIVVSNVLRSAFADETCQNGSKNEENRNQAGIIEAHHYQGSNRFQNRFTAMLCVHLSKPIRTERSEIEMY